MRHDTDASTRKAGRTGILPAPNVSLDAHQSDPTLTSRGILVNTQDILGTLTSLVNSFNADHPIVSAINDLAAEIRELRKSMRPDLPRSDRKLLNLNKLEAVVAEHPSGTQRQWAQLAGVSPAYVCKAMKRYPNLFGRSAKSGIASLDEDGNRTIDGVFDDENEQV